MNWEGRDCYVVDIDILTIYVSGEFESRAVTSLLIIALQLRSNAFEKQESQKQESSEKSSKVELSIRALLGPPLPHLLSLPCLESGKSCRNQ